MEIQDLTIAIPVRNEEKNLRGCLEAIGTGFAHKVVVLDSGSSDATVAIATAYGAEVIDFEWNGRFPKKRNWYLRHHPPATRWVLFLDADEYLTEDFKRQVRQSITRTEYVGFWLSYTIYFLGKQMKGGYPLKKLALFRVGAGEYERIEEERWSHLDMEIHEHPILNGPCGTIKTKIDHQDFRGIPHYVQKHNDYADWEVARYLKMEADAQARSFWTWKQKIKYRLMATPYLGIIFFFGGYFLLGGFRDGSRGLAFAIMKAAYFNQIYCKIKEAKDEVSASKVETETSSSYTSKHA